MPGVQHALISYAVAPFLQAPRLETDTEFISSSSHTLRAPQMFPHTAVVRPNTGSIRKGYSGPTW
eukprot:4419526-Pleurochrysis_carterae.AAC.1